MTPSTQEAASELVGKTRSGRVAIVGRPNVGKSTLLNAALGIDLAIVSKTPQTTRTTLLGVVRREIEGGTAELLLVDTPGLHEGVKTALNQRMNRVAREASSTADVVVLMTEVHGDAKRKRPGPLTPHRGDVALAAEIESPKVVLVINKIDLVKDKSALLNLLSAWSSVRPFDAIVPVSARTTDGVSRILDEVAKLLPEAPLSHEADDLTDRPMRYFAAEYVREQVLRRAREEVPHATAVTIDTFDEGERKASIAATIHVERLGQKKILIGERGSMLKEIGTEARKRIAELLGKPVHLELFVRETPNWRDKPQLLEELGYDDAARDASRPIRAERGSPRAPAKKKKRAQ